jgi:hypothetical protein
LIQAAIELKMLEKEIPAIYGIPVSTPAKNTYFERK